MYSAKDQLRDVDVDVVRTSEKPFFLAWISQDQLGFLHDQIAAEVDIYEVVNVLALSNGCLAQSSQCMYVYVAQNGPFVALSSRYLAQRSQ